MPDKSQHGRQRHPAQNKKGKGRRSTLTGAAQQPAITSTQGTAARAGVSAPPAKRPPSRAVPEANRYPHITGELRRISILTGVLLAVLVVLTRVLS